VGETQQQKLTKKRFRRTLPIVRETAQRLRQHLRREATGFSLPKPVGKRGLSEPVHHPRIDVLNSLSRDAGAKQVHGKPGRCAKRHVKAWPLFSSFLGNEVPIVFSQVSSWPSLMPIPE
jgi:hypothetical protein